MPPRRPGQVLIVEKDQRRVDLISNDLGNVVVKGDACEVSTLADIGTGRAEVVCAVTGDDGTALLKDIFAGSGSSNPQALMRVDDRLYFIATTPDAGQELWRHVGLGDDVVRPGFQTGDFLPGRIGPGHDNHRQARQPGLASHSLQHV